MCCFSAVSNFRCCFDFNSAGWLEVFLLFPSRWCCRQLFVIPALLAPLWSGAPLLCWRIVGGRFANPQRCYLVPCGQRQWMHFHRCYWARLQSGGKCQEAIAACIPPCPPPGHPDDSTPTDHVSWGCGPVPGPHILCPLGLPIHAPWDVPVCRAQAASVLSRGNFVGLIVVEGGIQNGFSLPWCCEMLWAQMCLSLSHIL